MKNDRSVKKMAFFGISDFPYEESWLNDLAERGLILKEIFFLYTFEKTGKTGLRCRIIPRKRDKISEEEMDLFESSGWKVTCSHNEKTYLYTEDPEAEELFTDMESYQEYFSRCLGRLLLQAGGTVLVLLMNLFNLYNLRSRLSGNGSFLLLAEQSRFLELGVEAFAVFVLGAVFYSFFSYIRCRRTVLLRKSPSEPLRYRGIRIFNGCGSIFLTLILCLMLVWIYFDSTKISMDDALTWEGAHPALMREAFPGDWAFVKEGIVKDGESGGAYFDTEGGRVSVLYDFCMRKTSNRILKEGFCEEVTLRSIIPETEMEDFDDSGLPVYFSIYYDFRSEEKAAQMLEEQVRQDLKYAQGPGLAMIDVPGCGYAAFLDERYDGEEPLPSGPQTLYLRSGTKVVYIYYSGRADLLDRTDFFAEQLK